MVGGDSGFGLWRARAIRVEGYAISANRHVLNSSLLGVPDSRA